MKTIIETEEQKEALRLVKSLDMACCLFEISNIWRKWKHKDEEPTGQDVIDSINDYFEQYGIDIEELIE